jgi:hypothetical protein
MPNPRQPFAIDFTVANEYQILLRIYGGVLTHYQVRDDTPPPTSLFIKHSDNPSPIFYHDYISGRQIRFDPIAMAYYHTCVDAHIRLNKKNKERSYV